MIGERRIASRGVTLIEMLIVVAMISIMAAGTMSVITGPMREQVIAGREAAAEAGASSFFSKLIPDAHTARELLPLTGSRGLRLTGAGPEGQDIVYFMDAEARLRRAIAAAGTEPAPGAGTTLLDDVLGVEAQRVPENGLWRVTLRAGGESLGRSLKMERSVELGVGPEFVTGGAQ